LIRAFLALAPASLLFVGALVLFARAETIWSFLQLVGAGCLVVVVLTHIAEAIQVLPEMGWDRERARAIIWIC
jgi:hypothetical protein